MVFSRFWRPEAGDQGASGGMVSSLLWLVDADPPCVLMEWRTERKQALESLLRALIPS